MKCEHCGAPMKLVRDRDYFVCEYCTAFHFPEEESRDGVRVLGQAVDNPCPVCQAKLVRAAIEGQDVLHCPNCKGVLSRRQAFIEILKRRRSTQPDDRRPLDPGELERQVRCPLCRERMETHPYYGPGHLVIDSCGRCAVIWFDHGEIDRIVRADQDRR